MAKVTPYPNMSSGRNKFEVSTNRLTRFVCVFILRNSWHRGIISFVLLITYLLSRIINRLSVFKQYYHVFTKRWNVKCLKIFDKQRNLFLKINIFLNFGILFFNTFLIFYDLSYILCLVTARFYSALFCVLCWQYIDLRAINSSLPLLYRWRTYIVLIYLLQYCFIIK